MDRRHEVAPVRSYSARPKSWNWSCTRAAIWKKVCGSDRVYTLELGLRFSRAEYRPSSLKRASGSPGQASAIARSVSTMARKGYQPMASTRPRSTAAVEAETRPQRSSTVRSGRFWATHCRWAFSMPPLTLPPSRTSRATIRATAERWSQFYDGRREKNRFAVSVVTLTRLRGVQDFRRFFAPPPQLGRVGRPRLPKLISPEVCGGVDPGFEPGVSR